MRTRPAESTSVIALQAVLRTKPQETLIVLHDVSNPAVGKPLSKGNMHEAKVGPIDDRQRHGRFVWLCLGVGYRPGTSD
jgi:hypothetical protein